MSDIRGHSEDVTVEGVVKLLSSGSALIRLSPPDNTMDDVYVSAAQVRRHALAHGDLVGGSARPPRRSERFPALVRVDTINGRSVDEVTEGSRVGDLPKDEDSVTTVDPMGPIFVVHGHARATLHEVVRVLERATGREVVVLHEQPNAGRTLLEKFEAHAAGAAYAVVLLTGDDEGGLSAGSERHLRGRQNVIFELGFFFGTLGRDRVAVLVEPAIEKPSDIDGLVYISLDSHGGWKQALARELTSVGIDVDYSRIPY